MPATCHRRPRFDYTRSIILVRSWTAYAMISERGTSLDRAVPKSDESVTGQTRAAAQ